VLKVADQEKLRRKMNKSSNPHRGPLFEDWLRQEGIYGLVKKAAIKRVQVWQIGKAANEQRHSNAAGASSPGLPRNC
jgi:hypothetical protein